MPRLGGFDLPSGSYTTIYTCPPLKRATISLNIVNRGGTPALLRLGFLASGSSSLPPSDRDFVEYDTQLPPGSTLERTGIAPYNSETLKARPDQAGVSIVVWGYEE